MPMTPKQFWETAATWGSFVKNGDPGACMYGFDEKGLVQSEDHRADCLRFIENECREAARVNAAGDADMLQEQNAELDELVSYLKTAPVSGTMPELDEFTTAYIAAALWSTSNPDSEMDNMLDEDFGPEHIDSETLTRMISDCARFQEFYDTFFEGKESQAGHDFWLTRCGHGAGFWDGDWGDDIGDHLTAASKSFGEFDLYVGDDGFIHGSGGSAFPALIEPSQVTTDRAKPN